MANMIWIWLSFSVALIGSGVCGFYVPRNVGPIRITGIYGVLTPKYYPMASIDIEASESMIHYLRKFFKTGSPNIPDLDPFHHRHPIPLVFDQDNIHATVNLSEFYITGAKAYVLDSLELRVETGRLDIVLDFPSLIINVDFIVDMKVDELKQYIAGHANITLDNVRMTTTLQAEAYPPGEKLEVQKLAIGAVEYFLSSSNTQYNLRNADTKQEIYWQTKHLTKRSGRETIGTKIALLIADKVSYISGLTIVHEIDDVLKHYNRAEILKLLVPGPKVSA